MSDTYCIKSGYRAGTAQATLDSDDTAPYWNASRVEASGLFQYYVYTTARNLLRAHGYRSAMDVGCGLTLSASMTIFALWFAFRSLALSMFRTIRSRIFCRISGVTG